LNAKKKDCTKKQQWLLGKAVLAKEMNEIFQNNKNQGIKYENNLIFLIKLN